jgi:cysteinyl-tRNA synthetase
MALSLAGAAGILGYLLTHIDLVRTAAQLRRVGISGTALFLGTHALALAGPLVAWHLQMRSDGIAVRFRTTLASFFMGRALNLISPMMYFGGESARTFHIASVCGVSRKRVLATIVVNELQVFSALTVVLLGALGVSLAAASLGAGTLRWAGAASLALALSLGLLFWVGATRPGISTRILGRLAGWGIFPRLLSRLQTPAAETEALIRGHYASHRASFIVGQALCLLSPLAQFVGPLVFYGVLRAAGEAVDLPSFSRLSAFFLLSQILIMVPTTPGGIGVFEAGLVGIFTLLSWPASDGAAYDVLFRLDDVLCALLGSAFLLRFGWGYGREAKENPPEGAPALAASPEPGEKKALRETSILLLCLVAGLSLLGAQAAPTEPRAEGSLGRVRTWMYQFQGLESAKAAKALASSAYDLLVVEPTGTYREAARFDMKDLVRRLKEGRRDRIVLAYLLLGEADSHRTYWGKDWREPGKGRPGTPDFLLKPDPDGWKDTYVVDFTDARWQDLVRADLRAIMAAGFDGLYLDWLEAYRDPEVKSRARASGTDPARAMVDFVLSVRKEALAQNPRAILVGQNAPGLYGEDDRLLSAVDGAAFEATWFRGKAEVDWGGAEGGDLPNRAAGPESTEGRLKVYAELAEKGKKILTIDYCLKGENARTVYEESRKRGFLPLVSQSALDRLTETPPPGIGPAEGK